MVVRVGGLGGHEGVGWGFGWQLRKLGPDHTPHLHILHIILDNLLQMHRHGRPIDLLIAARWTHAFGDVKDDGGETVLVEKDFFVVGDLAECADIGEVGGDVTEDGAAEELDLSERDFWFGHFAGFFASRMLRY